MAPCRWQGQGHTQAHLSGCCRDVAWGGVMNEGHLYVSVAAGVLLFRLSWSAGRFINVHLGRAATKASDSICPASQAQCVESATHGSTPLA